MGDNRVAASMLQSLTASPPTKRVPSYRDCCIRKVSTLKLIVKVALHDAPRYYTMLTDIEFPARCCKSKPHGLHMVRVELGKLLFIRSFDLDELTQRHVTGMLSHAFAEADLGRAWWIDS